MIAVTCRNGEHFSIDPDAIERVEAVHDTVVHMVDGSKYVVDVPFEDLLRDVRDHRAAAVVARHRLVDGYAATPMATRNARRTRPDTPIVVLPDHEPDARDPDEG